MDNAEKELLAQAVYDVVKTVPQGRATSYGAIARAVGSPNMPRLIGRIMGNCGGVSNGIPAHRVVNSQSILSGRDAFGGHGEMQRRLEDEGIKVVNNLIKNWKVVFWDPMKEIGL